MSYINFNNYRFDIERMKENLKLPTVNNTRRYHIKAKLII